MTRFLVAAAFALSLIVSAAPAGAAMPDDQKKEIEQIVRDYILANPEVIVQTLTKYQQDQQDKAAAAQAKNLSKYVDYLHASDRPGGGNPKGDVTVVEFFDYNCGYCKRALDDVLKLLESDKNLRLVLIDLPILGPTSELAAKWALAANKQGKYFDFHVALMKHNGPKTEESLAELAKKAGLDVERLKQDAKDPEIEKTLAHDREIAVDIGINGTPGFIVNDSVEHGYVGFEGLKKDIDAARKTGK